MNACPKIIMAAEETIFLYCTKCEKNSNTFKEVVDKITKEHSFEILPLNPLIVNSSTVEEDNVNQRAQIICIH